MQSEQEHFFGCPYCGENISLFLDMSAGGQNYIEDCSVCCNPIDITYEVNGGGVTTFIAKTTEE